MVDSARELDLKDQDLFLIELGEGDDLRYVVAERFLVIEPDHGALGFRWPELKMLFDHGPLRAVPMPGRRIGSPIRREGGVSTDPGVSTGPGVSTNVEINLFRVERRD